MKSILSLITLVYLIQYISSEDLPSITIQQDGIVNEFTLCNTDKNTKKEFRFSISVSTEGFTQPYEFNMPLAEPNNAFASCIVGEESSEQTRSTSETEYINCLVNTTIFPLYKTKVSLQKDYPGDGNFELVGWEDAFGKDNVITDFTEGEVDGCYPTCQISFKPSENLVDTCVENGHSISIKGEYAGEIKGTLNFPVYYLVEENKYRGAYCTLSKVSESNASDLELKCTVKDIKTMKFFDTIAYDETAETYVWISSSVKYELKDCSNPQPDPEPDPTPSFSSFIKLSVLLLLSLLF